MEILNKKNLVLFILLKSYKITYPKMKWNFRNTAYCINTVPNGVNWRVWCSAHLFDELLLVCMLLPQIWDLPPQRFILPKQQDKFHYSQDKQHQHCLLFSFYSFFFILVLWQWSVLMQELVSHVFKTWHSLSNAQILFLFSSLWWSTHLQFTVET